MNFFKQLSEIGVQNLELKVTIKDETLSVMIIPEIKNVNSIPLTVSGSAEELDAGFFDVISAPLKKTVGLTSNVEEFEDSLEEKPKATTGRAPAKPKAETKKKVAPYKHQKYLDAITDIVEAEDYELTEENKEELSEAVNKLLVMDSKNEVALEWEQKIKDLSSEEESENDLGVEEKEEDIVDEQPEPKVQKEEKPAPKEKLKETIKEKVEDKTEKKVTAPPAPPAEEETSSDEDIIFDDDDDQLDLDFEDFFNK